MVRRFTALLMLASCVWSGDPDPPVEATIPPKPTSGECVVGPEVCDGTDNDCDGEVDEGFQTTWYADQDADGVGDMLQVEETCDPPSGWVSLAGDCDDGDPTLSGPIDAPRFEEVSIEAGLDWLQWDGSVFAQGCGLEPLTGGAVIGDTDRDGDLDVFLPRMYAADRMFRNMGNSTFAEVSAEVGVDHSGSSSGGVFFDADGDEDLDLYVTSIGDEPNRFYINTGSGYYAESAALRGVDVPGASPCSATFAPSAGDVDNDGDLDLVLATWHTEGLFNDRARLFLNNGDGYFTDGTAAAGLAALEDIPSFGVTFVDHELDGDLDLYVVADRGASSIFLNRGDGTFQTTPSTFLADGANTGSAMGDLDGDADLDWLIGGVSDASRPCPGGWTCVGTRIYLRDGTSFFDGTDFAALGETGFAFGVALLDYDLDGLLDIAQTGAYADEGFAGDPARLWRSLGNGAFEQRTCEAAWVDRGEGRGLFPFDYDDDGDLDLLVVGNGETPRLYRAEGAESKGWLRVTLHQQGPNPMAVGARIEVLATNTSSPQLGVLHANATWLGGGPIEAHFGLGDVTGPAHAVTVTWPDGGQDVYFDVGPGEVLLSR